MGRDPDRLVDHDQVVVVVHDAHARHGLGHDLGRLDRPGEVDLEPAPGVDAVGLADRGSVERDPAAGREVGRLGPGHAEQPGQGGVDPLTLQALGHRQAPQTAHGARTSGSVGVGSVGSVRMGDSGPAGASPPESAALAASQAMPRHESTTIAMAEQTTKESARLKTG